MADDTEHLRGIRDYINRQLLPRIEQMRAVHRQRSKLFSVSALISTVVMVGILGFGGYAVGLTELTSLEFAAAVVVVVAYGLALHGMFHLLFVRGVRDRYVEQIAAPLVDRTRPDIELRDDERIDEQTFADSGIARVPLAGFESHEEFETEVRGATVRFSEVEAVCRGRKEGQKFARKQTCFALRGLFFAARLEEPAEGTTVMFPTLRRFANADELPRFDTRHTDANPVVRPGAGWPHIEWMPDSHPEPMGEVNVPDPEFHHLFDAYSTRIAEARDLLRAPVVERLKSIHSVWNSDVHRSRLTRSDGQGYFAVVIRDEYLYLARPLPRKLEELRMFEADDQVELLVQFAADIKLGVELIETIARRGSRGAGTDSGRRR